MARIYIGTITRTSVYVRMWHASRLYMLYVPLETFHYLKKFSIISAASQILL